MPALTCGEGPSFPPVALLIPGAELGSDGAAAALREAIRSGSSPETPLPSVGWSRVSDSESSVLFVAQGVARVPWVQVVVVRTATGWLGQTWGECQMQVKFPGDALRADVALSAATPPPGPESDVIHLVVTELACAGGQPPTGRVLEPLVLESSTAVVVAVGITPLPGAHDCPGNPSFPIDAILRLPLGGRVILDGGEYPAGHLFP